MTESMKNKGPRALTAYEIRELVEYYRDVAKNELFLDHTPEDGVGIIEGIHTCAFDHERGKTILLYWGNEGSTYCEMIEYSLGIHAHYAEELGCLRLIRATGAKQE